MLAARGFAVTFLLAFLLALAPAGPTVAASPMQISIPSIGVDARVIWLGLDPDGSMPAPNNPYDVGWYTFSVEPGALGNAVMAGHKDWRTGETGVFFRLPELGQGNEIIVTDMHGAKFRYVVVWSQTFADESAPIESIVGPTGDSSLTLITCEGNFDAASRNYDQRRIVRAVYAP
ncbi:MAG: class F sortase [Chloroflexi bacterium]|nr:class F sortase [Chloroflexota bacterium]